MSNDTNSIKTEDVTEEGWTGAFAAKSGEVFAETFAEDVVLEAATLLVPLRGRDDVKTVMNESSNYYATLQFTHEAINGPRTYVEWEASGPSGVQFSGVTVLTRNEDGLIQHISISHRPLAAALEFSDEMNRRTLGKIEPGHFRSND